MNLRVEILVRKTYFEVIVNRPIGQTKEENAMTINISSKQMEVTPAIRTHIEERLAKLNKWQTQLINPHFMIHKLPNGYEVEASIGTPVGDLFAKAEDADLYKAINEVETKLETQLNKQKHKTEARRADESLKKLNENH